MTSIQTLCIAGTLTVLATLAAPALAEGKTDPVTRTAAAAATAAQADAADMTDAEVRKVDTAQGKVTLKHGEIKHLDMPPMTMVFVVKDKAMLDSLKPGDKVRFQAANVDGKLVVTDIKPAN